ncbi:MAG: hypothetical protein AAGK47_10445 [Bacteroidota bacterium]
MNPNPKLHKLSPKTTNVRSVLASFLLIFTIVLSNSCSESNPPLEFIQPDGDGLFVEKRPLNNTDPLFRDRDNQIYTTDRTFKYSYYYLDKNNRKLKFGREGFSLVPYDSINNRIIDTVLFTTGGIARFGMDSLQTKMLYSYRGMDGKEYASETTGIIENAKNVWLHPPRSNMTKYFRITEINPFPYVQFPLTIGHSWEWTLGIGDMWSEPEWRAWEGSIINDFLYEITDYRRLETALGELPVYEVTAVATSRIGQTQLVSYFNEQYGFVKLHYTNIDSSQLIFNLEQVD